MGIKGFIVLVVIIVLSLFESSILPGLFWPIRIVCLFGIPIIVFVILEWIWSVWKPTKGDQDRLSRAISGMVAGSFLTLSIVFALEENRDPCDTTGCGQDRIEFVGEDSGSWLEMSIMLLMLSTIPFVMAVNKKEKDDSN